MDWKRRKGKGCCRDRTKEVKEAADTLSTGAIKTPEDAKKTVDLVISATDWATGKISGRGEALEDLGNSIKGGVDNLGKGSAENRLYENDYGWGKKTDKVDESESPTPSSGNDGNRNNPRPIPGSSSSNSSSGSNQNSGSSSGNSSSGSNQDSGSLSGNGSSGSKQNPANSSSDGSSSKPITTGLPYIERKKVNGGE